ncbi:MAG: hypothetical protein JNM38_15205 [Acidobacteria bacterium]|nr:hypothetical protein [Acidobacteriota bacterium]
MSSSMKVGLAVGAIVLLGVITWVVLNGEEDRPQIRVKSGSVTFADVSTKGKTSWVAEPGGRYRSVTQNGRSVVGFAVSDTKQTPPCAQSGDAFTFEGTDDAGTPFTIGLSHEPAQGATDDDMVVTIAAPLDAKITGKKLRIISSDTGKKIRITSFHETKAPATVCTVGTYSPDDPLGLDIAIDQKH